MLHLSNSQIADARAQSPRSQHCLRNESLVLTDIHQKIENDFGEKSSLAIEILDQLDADTKGNISHRLLRALVYLANGDVAYLKQVAQLAKRDWKDVLHQAEYSHSDNTRVRDFHKTFHELKLIEERDPSQSKS